MPPPFRKHVFVCAADGPDCAGAALLRKFREALTRHGSPPDVLIQATGCFDACDYEDGVVVVYPDGVWYGKVTEDDVEVIVDQHLLGDVPVKTLRIEPRTT